METFSDVFDTICRICGSPCKDEMVSLFEDDSGNLSCYGKAICAFANVVMSSKDNLPRKMCPNCLYQLRQAILFKIKCERNHKIFHILIANHNNETNQEMAEKTIGEYVMFKYYFANTLTKPDTAKVKQENQSNSRDFDSEVATSSVKVEIEYIPKKKAKKVMSRPGKQLATKKKKKKAASQTYKCEVCNKVLANKPTYEVHKWRHTGGRYMCELCGKGYATTSELDIHRVHSHGTGRYLQCATCGHKATSKFYLLEHQRLHTGERPFRCEHEACGLTFRRRFLWRQHRLLHGEKTLQCASCPRRFHRKFDLLAHCNNVHQRRFLYSCARCGRLYAKGHSMRRHYEEAHGVRREEQGRLKRILIEPNDPPAAATAAALEE